MVLKTFKNMSLRIILLFKNRQFNQTLLNFFCWPEVGPILLLRGHTVKQTYNADSYYVIVFRLKPVNIV